MIDEYHKQADRADIAVYTYNAMYELQQHMEKMWGGTSAPNFETMLNWLYSRTIDLWNAKEDAEVALSEASQAAQQACKEYGDQWHGGEFPTDIRACEARLKGW